MTRPARSSGTPSVRASGDAATPAAQMTVCAWIRSRPDPDALGVDPRHLHPGPDRHAQLFELLAGRLGKLFGVSAQHARAGLDQDHAGRGRVDVAEVACQGLPRDLGERAGQLDSGRAAADDHERHPGSPPGMVGLALGDLERHQAPAAGS